MAAKRGKEIGWIPGRGELVALAARNETRRVWLGCGLQEPCMMTRASKTRLVGCERRDETCWMGCELKHTNKH